MRTGLIFVVRPVLASVSMATPQRVASPSAGAKRPCGDAGEEAVERFVDFDTDDGVEIPAHAGVGHQRGAALEDAVVGGGDVGVGADDERSAAVEEEAHGLDFGRRLGVKVDDHGIGLLAERAGGDGGFDGAEGIVDRVHEDAALRVDDEHAMAVAALDEIGAAAGRAGGEVDGAEQSAVRAR